MTSAVSHDVSLDVVPGPHRATKPREFGMTEICAPYSATFSTLVLEEVFDIAEQWVDIIQWAGGPFAPAPPAQVRAFSDIAHRNNTDVSSGEWIERVFRYGCEAMDRHLEEAKEIGFDVIEISTRFSLLTSSEIQRMVEKIVRTGMKAKLVFDIEEDLSYLIERAQLALDAGASIIMIESGSSTENVVQSNAGAIAATVNNLGLENLMFHATGAHECEWYIKNYGTQTNLCIDHSQVLYLEGLRQNNRLGHRHANKQSVREQECPARSKTTGTQ